MRTITLRLFLIVFACFPHATLGQGVANPDKKDQDEALAQKIMAGDPDAMEQAGKSGNGFFIPYLRQRKDRDQRRGTYGVLPINSAAIALARLGEVQELQEFWCMAITDDPKRRLRTPPTEQLEWVGGWFAIQGLEKLLTPENFVRWRKPTRQEKESDSADSPVQVEAMTALAKILPNPPVPSTRIEEFRGQTQMPTYIKMWQDWIAAHKEELSKLQPTGEGVDFSPNACKNGKPRKKH